MLKREGLISKGRYLQYLIGQRKKGFQVSEQIALIRANKVKADVHPRFIPSKKFTVYQKD